ncbi:MAG TPA: helix-turn-helix transcriptional regulator [Dictyobacter sp.]|jgi:putative transcriptional regulator|nr:helix-turn-helix transcriptional regulator [Dictyobacter sp.]
MIRLRLKQVLDERGLTMAKVSRRADMAYNTVHSLCVDPYKDVNLYTLNRIADAIGVSVRDLLEDVPDNNAESI